MLQSDNQNNRAYNPHYAPRYAYPIQWGGSTCWPRGFSVFCVAVLCLIFQAIGHWSSIVKDFEYSASEFGASDLGELKSGHSYRSDIGAWVNARTVSSFPKTSTVPTTEKWGEFDDTLKLPFMQSSNCKKTIKATRAFFCLTTIFTLFLLGASLGNMMNKVAFKPVSLLTIVTLVFNIIAIGLAFAVYHGDRCVSFTKPTRFASIGLSPFAWCISAGGLLIATICAAVLLPREPVDGAQTIRK